jgi:hypothetical protein
MLKKSLFFGSIAVLAALLLITGCSNPTSSSSSSGNEEENNNNTGNNNNGGTGGNNAGDSGGIITGVNPVSADDLAILFKDYSTVTLGENIPSVVGEVPSGKTLIILGSGTKVPNAGVLNVVGTIEIMKPALLTATYDGTSTGLLTGSGQIKGDGAVSLPYLQQGASLPAGGVDYATQAKKSGATAAIGSVVAADGSVSVPAGGSIPSGLYDANGNLTLANITDLVTGDIPVGNTLTLTGAGNTISTALTLAADSKLIINGTLATTTYAITPANAITNNGFIISGATTAGAQQPLIFDMKGTGTVEFTAQATGAVGGTVLTQNVILSGNGKLTASSIAQPFTGDKTITITGASAILDLGATAANLTGVTIKNEGTGATAISTSTTSASALHNILALKGNITSSGAVTGNDNITVPGGTTLVHSGDFAGGTGTLTINGKATFGTGTLASQKGAITINEGAEATFTTATFALGTGPADPITVNGKATLAATAVPTGNVVVGSKGEIIVGDSGSLAIAAGKTLSNSGKVNLSNTGALKLPSTDTAASVITGAGKIAAGKTEITGAWKAKATGDDGTITITSTANGATIAKVTSTDGTLIAVGGATITQSQTGSNVLTVSADTIVDLTDGILVLGGAPNTDGGKASTTGTGKITLGNTDITGAWYAVGTNTEGTVTLTGSAAGASIAKTGTALTLKAATGTITQNAAAGNSLAIGADIDLTAGILELATNNTDTEAGSITATGTIIAGETSITGAWQSKGGAADKVTLTGSVNGAALAKGTSAVSLIAGSGASIIQEAGEAGNTLSIGTDVTLVLNTAGTITLVAGTNPGKITLGAPSSSILVGVGAGTALGGTSGLAIGGKTVVATTIDENDFKQANGKVVVIGGAGTGNLTANPSGIDPDDNVVIDSTKDLAGT